MTDATERASKPERCVVCGEAMDAAMSAECNWCDRRFHLNQRNDIEAKDCGEVWIDEQYLALQFACAECLSGDAKVARKANGKAATTTQPARSRRYKRRA